MLRSSAFPRIRALAYYSSYSPGWDNERDFRLDSSPDSLAVIRKYLHARGRVAAAAPPQPENVE
jgi:hypothetical protein